MRFIRLLFIIVLAVLLIAIAMANRAAVTLKAFPAEIGDYLGFNWQITLPLFLIIFLAIAFGIIVGFIWEWLREAHIRSEATRRKTEVDRLEREVGQLRQNHNAPQDDVLAILDTPRPIASAEPAPGTSLPAPR